MIVRYHVRGDIAVTVACHLADHWLCVAVGASLRLTATAVATAAHGPVFGCEQIGKRLQDFREFRQDATRAQNGLKNVGDVFHY